MTAKAAGKSKKIPTTPPRPAGSQRGYLVAGGVLFGAALVLLLALTWYVRPSSDDFNYAALTRQAYLAGGGLSGMVAAALEQMRVSYETWQGTYSSLFLFALNGMVADILSYRWEVVLIQLVFLGGVLLLAARLLLASGLVDRAGAWGSGLFLAAFFILYLPGIGEGLLWRNSMVIYSLAIGVQCLTICLLLELYRAQGLRAVVLWTAGAALLLAYLGGSNYITALCSCFGLFLLCGWLVWRRDARFKRFLLPFLVSLAGLLVTVTAPGNRMRATHFEQSDLITTLMRCFEGAFRFVGMTLRGSPLVLLAALVLWACLPGLRRSSFDFRRPWLVAGASVIWFAAHFAPTIFAASSLFFELRIINTYFVSLTVLVLVNTLYLGGWVVKNGIFKGYRVREQRIMAGVVCGLALMVHLAGSGVQQQNAYRMAYDLSSGAAEQFAAYVEASCDTLAQSTAREVALSAYDGPLPLALETYFLEPDPTHWRNQGVASYYGKDSVRVES